MLSLRVMGVYRCGFAKRQEAYDTAVKDLGDALAKAESLLSQQRYVCGTTFTYMDLRLFMTLIRFNAVHVVYFKTNVGTIEMNYPNLLEYCKDIYQVPGMAKAINMRHIKMHYLTSHPDLKKFAVIPRGRDVDYSGAHKRAKFTSITFPSQFAPAMLPDPMQDLSDQPRNRSFRTSVEACQAALNDAKVFAPRNGYRPGR